MDLNTFFQTASPTTLAGIIADVVSLDMGASHEQMQLEAMARKYLVANVGEQDGDELIHHALNCV